VVIHALTTFLLLLFPMKANILIGRGTLPIIQYLATNTKVPAVFRFFRFSH
jgi:hypothetical protein